MKDKYAFIHTAKRDDGEIVALIGDREKCDIDSLRKAFKSAASPRMRTGVMVFTVREIQERLQTLIEQGDMPDSVAAFRRAEECIELKRASQAD